VTNRAYEIHEVAQLTGLSPARLRAWERRYKVVRPQRLANGYRVYTADQVALLRAYARLIDGGERIGDLAVRPREEVLTRAERAASDSAPQAAILDAIRTLDRELLEGLVAEQLALRGARGFAEEVVLPLARRVGDLWALGEITIAAEHLATEVVIHALKGALRISRSAAPLVACGCLAGERHEWGVLATLAIAQDQGWRVHYLGPDLPADQLVEAAWRLSPRAVALSAGDPTIVRAALPVLATLPARLPPGTIAILGGAGMEPHDRVLRGYGYRIGLEAFGAARR
jgi:DNA-binding transcriptional MerR regulator